MVRPHLLMLQPCVASNGSWVQGDTPIRANFARRRSAEPDLPGTCTLRRRNGYHGPISENEFPAPKYEFPVLAKKFPVLLGTGKSPATH
jgi:hypothetical protein